MAKPIKYLLYCVAGVVVIAVVGVLYFGYRFKSETARMNPVTTRLLVDGVYSVNTQFVNFYLVRSNDLYVAIDTGTDMKTAGQELEKLKIDPTKVKAIFLTHTDGDHTGAIKLFGNAAIYLSKEEEPLVKGEIHKVPFVTNKVDGRYALLSDMQELDIGSIHIKGILTPGHTPGSMSYLVNDKYLFTGDTLRLNNGKADTFNDFFNMDTKTQRESNKKLTKLDNVKYVFTAHHGFSADYSEAMDNWN